MTHQQDLTRCLKLTLLGDREAAKTLQTLAARLELPLLKLAAEAVLHTDVWRSAWQVLQHIPAAALTPELLNHFQTRLVGSRHMVDLHHLPESQHSALWRLVTDVRISAPTTQDVWETLCTINMDSMKSLHMWSTPRWFQPETLDLKKICWFEQLEELSILATSNPQTLHFGLFVQKLAALSMPKLTTLNLSGGEVDVAAVERLCRAPWVQQLESLTLNRTGFSSGAAQALVRASLPRLRKLSLLPATLQAPDLVALANAPFFLRLKGLFLPEEHVLEAVAALPEDAHDARLMLMSQCDHALKPTRQHQAYRPPFGDYTQRIARVGIQSVGLLSKLEQAIRDRFNSPLACQGAERALVCVFQAHPQRAHGVGAQAQLVRILVLLAQAQRCSSYTFSLGLPHVQEPHLRAQLIAQLLLKKSTQFLVRDALFLGRLDLDSDAPLRQQIALAALSSPFVRPQNHLIRFLDGGHSQAIDRLRDSIIPYAWSALTEQTPLLPGPQAYPDIAWPVLQSLNGIFRFLRPTVSGERVAPFLRAALARAVEGRFQCDRDFLNILLSDSPTLDALLASLPPAQRAHIVCRMSRWLCKQFTQYLDHSPTARALCPPWSADWPCPALGLARARWNALSAINVACEARATGDTERLRALLSCDNRHLQDLARQALDTLKDHGGA